jgi:hypothetical protein
MALHVNVYESDNTSKFLGEAFPWIFSRWVTA